MGIDLNGAGNLAGAQRVDNEADKRTGLTPEAAQLLTEVGFLAVQRNRFPDAEKIFSTLQSFRPGADFPVIGLALTAMSQGRNEEAITGLLTALVDRPESEDLKVFLSLALMLGQRSWESQDVAGQLIANGEDPLARGLARQICGALENVSPADSRFRGGLKAPTV